MTRTPQEIIADHGMALAKLDLAEILKDYRADSVVLTSQGVLEGLAGVEAFYRQALDMLPKAEFSVVSITYGADAALMHWTAFSVAGEIKDGVDSFVFEDGAIRLQTVSFTFEPLNSL
jgi:hypothetical protein